ncbi:MAG: bifunctional glutamate N-acetyltransferase/amino-acid acetyltransferase ArgJ [Actinomycetota bacterium]|nr:bifunctional glutamate N-acetyltransferase/amino-acid acetyltransferase ArgJ [Actinomycetota bacterium]
MALKNKKDKKDFNIVKNGTITTVPGFYASGFHCGIKKSKKPDIGIIYAPEGGTCSGIFTTNNFLAAPVIVTMEKIKNDCTLKAVVVNSGIANSCTGKQGYVNAKNTVDIASEYLKVSSEEIAVSSTGIIGKQLPMDKIEKGIKKCYEMLNPRGGHDAAEAIITTDSKTKEVAVSIKAGSGREIVIGGIAKGSGMVKPGMATLLVFITTSAGISKNLLDKILHEEADSSFNSITIDGCQSTNDMVLVMTNSKSGICIENEDSEYYKAFKNAFSFVMKDLAEKIIMDGEGATKFVKIKVTGAKDKLTAKKLALKVADSNLFKTAMFGQDINWGRINAALGSAECDFDPAKVDIYLNDILIVAGGVGADFDKVKTKKLMKKRKIGFTVDMNQGDGEFEVLTTDLSLDYIKINALYKSSV